MGPQFARRERSAEQEVLRLVQDHASELLRFAQRFSICADDAHDAYQRSLEILLRRMRTDPPRHPLGWLRTVLKHEALIVRAKREQLLARRQFDVDTFEQPRAGDVEERAVGWEQLRQTAEALQRLKPQEVDALLQRAQGFSYREIAERNGWTYTKVNRCVSEGRRALLARLGAIESGAECARWLPLVSALADGEATAAQLAELRPHLRACPACRATLRRFHEAPRQVAAVLPLASTAVLAGGPAAAAHAPVLAGRVGLLVGRAWNAVHAAFAHLGLAAGRAQEALEAVPAAKLAAVAASSAALAGGGVALEQVATQPPAPVRAALPVSTGAATSTIGAPASAPSSPALAAGQAADPAGSAPPDEPSSPEFARDGAVFGASAPAQPAEFDTAGGSGAVSAGPAGSAAPSDDAAAGSHGDSTAATSPAPVFASPPRRHVAPPVFASQSASPSPAASPPSSGGEFTGP